MKRWILGTAAALLLTTPALSSAKVAQWKVPGDFATIQLAIDSPSVATGDTILVGPGNHAGAFVTKSVEIKGTGRATISSGPVHGSGMIMGFRLLAGSDGTTISHLTFTVDLAIMNGGAANDVTVTQCTFLNAVQAVSNWRGTGWGITENVITDLRTNDGGGIGILVGDYTGGSVTDNVISHNKISGTLHVSPTDGGGYAGSGIVLYADYRYGGAGAEHLWFNRVVKNQISLTSDTPAVVDVVAFELTDTNNNATVVCDNAIGFNDFRGTANQIALTPLALEDCNAISRNLGENRGHGGLHPSAFGPGGNQP